MIELTPFAGLLRAAGNIYWLLALAGIATALWRGRTWQRKLGWAALVLALFVAPLVPDIYRGLDYRIRYAKAKALFDERCKTAGEKVYRAVENVEGVLLLNLRAGDIVGNRANPLWDDAALPNESGGDQYIRNFLYWEHNVTNTTRGILNEQPMGASAGSRGYRFADVLQLDGSVIRYRLKQPGNSALVREPVKGQVARYAVGFVNQVKPEDRAQWVAGTTISIVDTQTNEVVARRESYSFEPGLGDTSGARSPWGFAETCPSWKGWDSARTRFFVDQVLKPTQEE